MKKHMSEQRKKEIMAAYLFLLPTLIGYAIFIAGPTIAAFTLSLCEWDVLTPPNFTGLSNFRRLLHDARFLIVLKNTLIFTAGAVGLEIIIGLIIALMINRGAPGILRYFFRTTYFFPVIVSLASVSIVWQFLLNTDFGPINYYLGKLGFDRIPWLSSSRWALPSIIGLFAWKNLGFYMVLFLAALQSVPRQLYEAAEIDGASSWQKFWGITLSLITPTLFFAIVIGLIGAFQLFDAPYIMTEGGPGDATRTLVMYIYLNGFRFLKMGYAVSCSMVLLAIILICTIFQFGVGRKWVFYQ
jgi:multiple sugar transport system permease protein